MEIDEETQSSLTGFILAKSDIFTVKRCPVFLIKIAPRKDCWCTAVSTILINQNVQQLFDKIRVRCWFQFCRLQSTTLKTSQKNNQYTILVLHDASTILEISSPIESDDSLVCCKQDRNLVNYNGKVTDVSHIFDYTIELDGKVVLLFPGKIKSQINCSIGDTLCCYNVWLLKDTLTPSRLFLVANCLSTITGADDSPQQDNLTTKNTILYKIVHSYSLTPQEVVKMYVDFERGKCSFDDRKVLSRMFQNVYSHHFIDKVRITRQFIMDFIHLNPWTDITKYENPEILYPLDIQSNLSKWSQENFSTVNSDWKVDKKCADRKAVFVGSLDFDASSLSTFVKDDHSNKIKCRLEHSQQNNQFTFRLDELVSINQISFVTETFSATNKETYLTGVLNESSSPDHLPCPQCLRFQLNSLSGLRLSGFSCHISVENSKLVSIDFSGTAIAFFILLNHATLPDTYWICCLNMKDKCLRDRLIVTSCTGVILYRNGENHAQIDKQIFSVAEVKEVSVNRHTNLDVWGRLRCKYSILMIELEDTDNQERIRVTLPSESLKLSLLHNRLIALYGLTRLSANTGRTCSNFIAYPGSRVVVLPDSADTDLRHCKTNRIQYPRLHISQLTDTRSNILYLTTQAHIVRIFHLHLRASTSLPCTATLLVDDGTAMATVFLNRTELLRQVLALTLNQWELLTSTLAKTDHDYHYPPNAGTHWLDKWLSSSMVLRPILFTLRREENKSDKSVNSTPFDLKKLTIGTKEFEMLVHSFLRFYCLDIQTEF